MSATVLILLLLLLMLFMVIMYYVCLCCEKPKDTRRKALPFDEGPLLAADFNGHHDTSPPRSIDEPDRSDAGYDTLPKTNDQLVDLNEKGNLPSAPVYAPKELDFPLVKVCVENEKLVKTEPIPYADDITDAPEPDAVPFYNPLADAQRSDEEDGLVQHSSILHSPSKEPDNHEQPQKRVHFMPVPITVSIDVCENADDSDVSEDTTPICIGPILKSGAQVIDVPKPTLTRAAEKIPETTEPPKQDPAPPASTRPPFECTPIGLSEPKKDVPVKVLFPSDHSQVSSSEDLSSIPSDTDTSEPEVTEYSFEMGPMVPSTSDILANEISSCMEPKVTRFVSIPDDPVAPDSETSSTISDDTSVEDNQIDILVCPGEGDHSLNTPPSTPPEGKLPEDLTILSNPGAEFFVAGDKRDTQRTPGFIVIKTHRPGSRSSSCSSSSDDTPVRESVTVKKETPSQIPRIPLNTKMNLS